MALTGASQFTPSDGGVSLRGAKNEWISFAVEVSGRADDLYLTADPLINPTATAHIAASNFNCYQVAPIAGKPFALLPLDWQAANQNRISLSSAPESTIFWIDLHLPPDASAGRYTTHCRLTDAADHTLASLPVQVTVYDFALPLERHLTMAGILDFDAMAQLDPAVNSAPSPRLLSRADAASTSTIGLLDTMVGQAQAHRANLVIPQLQPNVKWPASQPPEIDWNDFDSLVGPWLSGQMFPDRFPLAWWPIPKPELLDSFDDNRQQQYWKAAADHFTQQNWLTPALIFLDQPAATPEQRSRIAAGAAMLLAVHPLLNVTVPLPTSDLGDRIQTVADGLVAQTQPSSKTAAKQWLRPSLRDPADESDIRLWAWLAFLHQADVIVWPDASDWFYPGRQFGRSRPVASSQLLWLRRAEQDYEYLWLEQQRGQTATATLIAGLLTRFVQVPPPLESKPSYALICGTEDSQAWDDALGLLARTNQPMNEASHFAFNVDLAEWQSPRARTLLLPGAIDWRTSATSPNQLTAAIGVDIYNGTGRRIGGDADQSTLRVASAGPGWRFDPQPRALPQIESCGIARLALPASFDLSKLANTAMEEQPIRFTFLDGYTRRQWGSEILAPVAVSDRRRSPVVLDGVLDDWSLADCIHDGPLVNLLDRDSVAVQRITRADTSSQLFTGWSDDYFYLAFQVRGAKAIQESTFRNFVDESAGNREDLCELLLEAVDPDNTLAPPIHIICQINSPWTQRKIGDQWQPMDSSAIRYAGTIDDGIWRGELAIPWTALIEAGKPRPRILRFNFTQRRQDGSGASWAGPVEGGRDELLTGLLYLRDSPP